MGTLLHFSDASRPHSRVRSTFHVDPRHRQSAEIIFFPGVRYERDALELSARIATIQSKVDRPFRDPS